jgi:polyisoprenyl-teichoic acid--peptidoglycan teichoic acid transferase
LRRDFNVNQPDKSGSDVFFLTTNARPADKPLKVTYVSRNTKPPRTAWTYTKWALAGMFCLMSAMAGTWVGSLYWKSPIARQMIINTIMHRGDPLAPYKPSEQFPLPQQHEITLLLLGVDHDYDERKPIVLKTRGRSDAILLAKVNFDTGDIKAFSIPRDCYVHIPDHSTTKINAAYAMGGSELTKETIKSVFGISVDYYAAFNFDGFKKIVDALGGIDLDVKRDMDYDDNWGNLHIHLKQGYQHLNGTQAMGYVRYRHGDNDLMRAERQQQFIEALRAKIKSPQTLLNLGNVLNALTDSISSDMTTEQMLTLGNFAKGLKRENIELGTLPVIEGPSYVYIKREESEELIRRLFYPDGLTPVSVTVPARRAVVAQNERRRGSRKGRKSRTSAANIGESTANPDDVTIPETSVEEMPVENSTPESGGNSKPEATPNPPDSEPKPSGGEGGASGGSPSGGGEPSSPSGDGTA